MATTTIQQDLTVIGNLQATGQVTGNVPRASLILENGSAYGISPHEWRIWDAYQTGLGTGSGDDLGVATGTYATQISYVRTPDLNASGGPNNYRARHMFRIPHEYEIGQDLVFRVLAGMVTAVAGTSATIDVEILQPSGDLSAGSDLVTTAAQSINSLVFSTYDFAVTGSGLSTGAVLDIRVTITTTSATASSHFGAFSRAELLIPTRG